MRALRRRIAPRWHRFATAGKIGEMAIAVSGPEGRRTPASSWLRSILLALGWAFASFADAPERVAFQRLAIPDDVPAQLCSALLEDTEGFLWIGTQGGLVRYDGYQFRVFRFDPNDDATIGGSYVRSIISDRRGRLWVGTFSGGLSMFDPASERFKRYRNEPGNPRSLSNDRVEGLAEDSRGRIWIATDEGLDRLESDGRITRFRHAAGDASSLADDRVRGLLVDRAGRVWVGSRGGLQVWSEESGAFRTVASAAGVTDGLSAQQVSRIFEDSRGRIWVATSENGAAVVDPETGSIVRRYAPGREPRSELGHFWVYGVAEVGGEIWIATFGGGVDVVDAATLDVVRHIRHDDTLDDTIGGDRIGAILRDRSGVVWIGTWGQGIARHDPATRAFQAMRHSSGDPKGLTHTAAVRALELQDGTIWVGTNGNGIDILGRDGRLTGGYRPAQRDPGALADGAITCLAQSDDGTIWVATLDGTLHRMTPGAGRFRRLTAADGLPRGPARTMAFGADGTLWLGAAEGMAKIDPASLKITAFRHDPGDADTLSGNAVESILVDASGRLWVGTTTGLNLFDPATGKAVRILRDPSRRDSLPDNWVPDLMLDRKGRLWLAGQAGAHILTGWDGHTARFTSVAAKLRRRSEPVQSLLEDAAGRVWLGATVRVDPERWTFDEFGPADGCSFRNFYFASRSRTGDGRLLFGSPEGLLEVRPERIAPWTFEPGVVATSISVGGIERRGASTVRSLELSPEHRSLRVEFASLDLTAPQRNRYRYHLEGYDDRWVTTDASQRSITYANLPPRSYTLVVQGTNRAGRWSPRMLRIDVVVHPAFYQTGWFRLLAAVLLVALVYGGYRLRVRQIEARNRRLQQLVDERTAELAEKNRQLEGAYAQIEEASLTDPLTGLRNRRYLEQVIASDEELALRGGAAGEEGEAPVLVFLLVDLDHFKSVNDTHGHAAGDAVLQQTAALLHATFRAADHVVRWGGEEFLVVVRFVAREEAASFAEKLRASMEQLEFTLPSGGSIRRTCSIGFAVYPFLASDPRAIGWHDVVDLADKALYGVKHSGRNGWAGVWPAGNAANADVVRRFRDDPAAAVASGLIRLEMSGKFPAGFLLS